MISDGEKTVEPEKEEEFLYFNVCIGGHLYRHKSWEEGRHGASSGDGYGYGSEFIETIKVKVVERKTKADYEAEDAAKKKEDRRKAALTKLTPEDIEALGIKE